MSSAARTSSSAKTKRSVEDKAERDEDISDEDSEDGEDDDGGDEDDDGEDSSGEEGDALGTLDPAELVILRSAGVLPKPRQPSKRWEKATRRSDHIVFVDDAKAGMLSSSSCQTKTNFSARLARMYKLPDSHEARRSQESRLAEEEPIDLGWIMPDNSKAKERAAEEARQAKDRRRGEEDRMAGEAKVRDLR